MNAEHQVVGTVASVWASERFWAKVAVTPGCWLWMAAINPKGYGSIKVAGRKVRAHVVAFIGAGGAIPTGQELDHLCRVRHCVNPAHLEPVTHRENIMRSENHVAAWAARTQCDQGHPFDPRNTRIRPGGARLCLTCHREYQREWARRKRLASVVAA